MRTLRVVAVGLFLLGLVGVPEGVGQQVVHTDSVEQGNERARDTLREGVEWARDGRYQRAIDRLAPLFERDSTALDRSERATLAYWLGHAYKEEGAPGRALDVWRGGVTQQLSSGTDVDLLLADAYVRAALRQQSTGDYPRAADTYLLLLRAGDRPGLTDREHEVVRQHLRELAVILPGGVQARTGLRFDRKEFSVSVDRTAGAGQTLVEWWRSQDPVPSTRQNERVLEHLRRVARARAEFSHEGVIDDRGKVYIRLGRPHRDQSVGMSDAETVQRITRSIRRNEFWTYPHVDRKAYYLFVERDPEVFEVGGVTDLFPPSMMPGRRTLYKMERVLRDLATFHGDYGLPAADVFARAAWSRDNEQFGIGSDPYSGTVQEFVEKMEDRIDNADRKNAERRRRRVPASYSSTANEYPDLPVAARTARFLTPSGETRFEVYWSVPTAALAVPDDDRPGGEGYDIAFLTTVLREDARHDRADKQRYQDRISVPAGRGDALRPRSFFAVTTDSVFHVAAQWDQYVLPATPGGGGPRRMVRRHTARYDTLTALTRDPETLEMSDLQLMSAPRGAPPTAIASDGYAYPFQRVDTSQTLALRFETYHLAYGDDDRTRYTISYEVNRKRSQKGFFARVFGGDDEERTSVTTTHQGADRRTTEYILLDLGNLVEKKASAVRVTVRVTDEVTDQTVERALEFEAVAGG
jgi:GWxTD domain-containing protein